MEGGASALRASHDNQQPRGLVRRKDPGVFLREAVVGWLRESRNLAAGIDEIGAPGEEMEKNDSGSNGQRRPADEVLT